MKETIDCIGTLEVVCPLCGYEHKDSWELNNDQGEVECDDCGEIYSFQRVVDITYSTFKINE